MSAPPADKLRIAVEGCGHGTLDAIYDAVARSCGEKGWDGVDALIIGGDFQATRNKRDLNVTAMPPKYRDMADFHQYYSGAKTAPCLTIFVGGNHEASNHLFELYYGGWVAPNIYFLGAANVIRLGNIRIAGLSGIWKGYDYRKPHFERLPYNQEDISSIYHVRELDVRKLLAVRSQVDIGVSHDWPQSVEWSGDWEWLFRRKDGFQRDAEDKTLGSEAARYLLDRLRPPYWFSAHLHIRYTASYDHEDPKGIQTRSRQPQGRLEDRQQLSAWNSFGTQAQRVEAAEGQQFRAEHAARKEEEARTGVSSKPVYKFDETFKKVAQDNDDLTRKIESVEKSENTPTKQDGPPQLDGCSSSRPLKRSRASDSPQGDGRVPTRSPRFSALDTPTPRDVALGKTTKPFSPAKLAGRPAPVSNPDELDLGSDEEAIVGTLPVLGRPSNADQLDLGSDEEDTVMVPRRAGSPFPNLNAVVTERKSEQSEDGGAPLNPIAADFTPVKQGGVTMARQSSGSSRSSLDPAAKPFKPEEKGPDSPMSTASPINPEAAVFVPRTNDVDLKKDDEDAKAKEDISTDVRAELDSMSKTFTAPVRVVKSADLPFPEEITNKKTEFLALDKCLPNRNFLELIEVESISAPGDLIIRPLKPHYDPEWLAILRVFADELAIGGRPNDPGPPHRGDTYYQDRILEERKWVFQNIVLQDQVQVPDNFEITAPVYDPNEQVDMRDMPREVTNPQTSAFCQLIGIDNKFDITQAERDAREATGPRPESERFLARRGASRGGRGGNQRGGGRGGRGGRGRGAGRGGGYGGGGYGGGRGRGGQRGRGY